MRRLNPIRWVSTVAAIAALSLVGISGPALAEDPAPGPGVGNIDPDVQATLTIHKSDGDEGDRGNGTEITDPAVDLGRALEGVEFTIRPVLTKDGKAIDLDTAEGWNLIDNATVDTVTAANGYTFGTDIVRTTDGAGLIEENLDHGLYLITETDPGDNNIISQVEPFLVTLPLPQTNGGWLYDVHVYPKNAVNDTEATKAVSNPDGLKIGSSVVWTITSTVPKIANGDTYTSFTITDALDPRLTCTGVTVEGFVEADYTVTCTGQTANVEFTAAGLSKLTAGQSIETKVTTTVDSLGEGTDAGIIDNKAVVSTNGSSVETNDPKTNWGALKIFKHAAGDDAAALSGAKFEVYESKTGSVIGTITTNENGEASIELWVGSDSTTTKTLSSPGFCGG